MRTVWTLAVTVHGPCLWQVCRSAKTLESPPFISRTPNSWRFLQKGQRFPLLSYISPFPHICQFYVRGLGMPVIVQQHENDVNFPTGPFVWDVDSKAADNSCKDANTSHHLQNYFLAPRLCQSYTGDLQRGGGWWYRVMSCFQQGLKSPSSNASALSSGRWWWWWCWSEQWSWWWWLGWRNLPQSLFAFSLTTCMVYHFSVGRAVEEEPADLPLLIIIIIKKNPCWVEEAPRLLMSSLWCLLILISLMYHKSEGKLSLPWIITLCLGFLMFTRN